MVIIEKYFISRMMGWIWDMNNFTFLILKYYALLFGRNIKQLYLTPEDCNSVIETRGSVKIMAW